MKRTALLIAALVVTAGCNGGVSSFTPAPQAAFKNVTNASLEAIDCDRKLAYVPIAPLGATDAEVAALDLSGDPDTTDPRKATIDLDHEGPATGAAIAAKQGLALIISGSAAGTGFLDEINETDNSLVAGSPFAFPAGSQPAASDGIVFDALDNSALVSMTSTPVTCPNGSSTSCTGMANFNLGANSFDPLIQFDTTVNNFGFDPRAQIAIAPSDPVEPIPYAINVSGNAACTLTDDSLVSPNDPDGTAVDPATGIWVIGNFDTVLTTVINLAGATFSGTTPPCSLQEAGAPPSNSVNFNTGAGEFMPGVAINPVTHQALLTGLLDNQIALISLPKTRVQFVDATNLRAVDASLPLEPDGLQFQASIFPYSATIDTCHNRAYIVNAAATFMAEVDLKTMEKDPGAINTALPAGNCAGTSTTLSCNNQNGVRFFPLPGV